MIVHADVPGFKPEQVKIEIADGVLTISGEREERKEENEKTVGFLIRLATIVLTLLVALQIAQVSPSALLAGSAFTAVIVGLAAAADAVRRRSRARTRGC
jgi:small-conductance mechanosensitive channel